MPSLSHIIEDQQQKILDIYFAVLGEDPKTQKEAEELIKYLPSKPPKDPNEMVAEFLLLDRPTQLMVAKHLARISDMQNRVRNAISSKFAGGFADQLPIDAYSLRYTLQQFRNGKTKISSKELQSIFDQMSISASITAHPTNPYSTEYTVKSMELDHILAEEKTPQKAAKIKEQIRAMIATDPTPSVLAENKGKKTQIDEVVEARAYMRNIYEQLPVARRKMQEVLKEEGYEDVKIGKFYEMGAWLSGDGDGNFAATAASLQQNINLFREEIIRLYLTDLTAIEKLISNRELKEFIGEIITKLDPNSPDNQYTSPAQLIGDLNKLLEKAPENSKQKLEDLIYRVQNFGFNYAKIDVRHDAGDINTALVEVLSVLEEGGFRKMDEATKKALFADLQNGQNIEKHSAFLSSYLGPKPFRDADKIFADLVAKYKEKPSKDLEVAIRIFGRLQVVAKNPDCSDKLIIAECKNQANALAAMLLLKASGNSVNKEGSLNIVTLSESADDLIALPQNIRALLANKTYLDHVLANGKLYYMIAKSDTQRRDGVGAQFAQELPPEQVTDLFAELIGLAENREFAEKNPELAEKYSRLKNVKLIPFNGGGHALQRGGGRIDEIPNVYQKAAMRGIHWSGKRQNFQILPPVLTTQGHQNGILFSAGNAENFFMSYLSQSIYAEAKMRGIVPEKEVSEGSQVNVKAQAARINRGLFFQAARKVYQEQVVTQDSPINILFRKGPWAGIDLTNVSSRPGKRVEDNKTPQLIDQRAIGAERMCAHSGTHLLSWYSARAGLEAVGLQNAKSMYVNDKSTRDTCRSMAMSLFMTDFDISWRMMIGEKRPSMAEIKKSASKYGSKEFDLLPEKERDKITLAHIEVEAIETAKLIYKIAGGEKELTDLAPKELLKELWANLATEIENREAKLKFAHMAEAAIMADLPLDQKRYPKDPETAELIRFLNTACVGTEAPTIAMISSTKRIGDHVMRLRAEDAEKLSVVGDLSSEPSVQNAIVNQTELPRGGKAGL